MKTLTIEFNETSASPTPCVSPWASPVMSSYQDKILTSEFAAKRHKFAIGTTWLRIVPALPESVMGWMLGVHALNYVGGRHCHPKSITPGAKSVFDDAYGWCKKNCNELLYSKANKEGFRLLADPLCLFWMLVEEGGRPTARLLMESGYDGSRGGTPGLGHQIWQLTQEKDEDGNLLINPADPKSGAQICIEKRQVQGSRFANYSVKRGRVPAPVNEMIAEMDPEEVAALVPLEQVVHLPTNEEEWCLLTKVIDADTVGRIRNSAG
jgi:hypothetical protein